jgi:hypothetical protein
LTVPEALPASCLPTEGKGTQREERGRRAIMESERKTTQKGSKTKLFVKKRKKRVPSYERKEAFSFLNKRFVLLPF